MTKKNPATLVKQIDKLANAGILPLKNGKVVKPLWYAAMQLHPPGPSSLRGLDHQNTFKPEEKDVQVLKRLEREQGNLKEIEEMLKPSLPNNHKSLRKHVKMPKDFKNMPGNTFGVKQVKKPGFNGNIQPKDSIQFNSRQRSRAIGGSLYDKSMDLEPPKVEYPEDVLTPVFYEEHAFELSKPIDMVESANDLNYKANQDWKQVPLDSPLDLLRKVVEKAKVTPDASIREIYMDTVKQFRLHQAQLEVEERLKAKQLHLESLPQLLQEFDQRVNEEIDQIKAQIETAQGSVFEKRMTVVLNSKIAELQSRAQRERTKLEEVQPKPTTDAFQQEELQEMEENRILLKARDKEALQRRSERDRTMGF